MAAITSSLSLSPQYTATKEYPHHGPVVEEIEGLIRVHKDGYVERPQVVPCVTASALSPELNVNSRDMVIDNVTNIWARFYVPICQKKLPLLVYFHGGGFCVGSAAWSCYHDFLARLSTKVGCVIMSVNYRLAPENPLPAPYDDGLKALMWVKQQLLFQYKGSEWWTSKCNFSSVFLAGDSAGANIAYNVATRLDACEGDTLRPLNLKGLILIQPFFGGEVRTNSEKCMAQSPGSALNLAASDTYWRLALPSGANRDHPWCNPLVKFNELKLLPTLVCISEMDILKDRNLEFCDALAIAGKKVEYGVFKGVGHAFQILSKSQLSKIRANEIMARVKSFMFLR
ncbi:probable carboxylesterase 17 [Abrus precatorius]|uniref:Probable carboxylesterase 17 n=1 Tax=Abrus precatorius TaxID=3816 RepID=A0A8B8MA06_ABRPR|nr:probable carboxylesterase 17 [Abrus precatorius]